MDNIHIRHYVCGHVWISRLFKTKHFSNWLLSMAISCICLAWRCFQVPIEVSQWWLVWNWSISILARSKWKHVYTEVIFDILRESASCFESRIYGFFKFENNICFLLRLSMPKQHFPWISMKIVINTSCALVVEDITVI